MNVFRLTSAALLSAAILAGCSSMPAADSPLTLARNDFNAARASSEVNTYAAGELGLAGSSLEKADNAQAKGEKAAVVDHLAYVARQQVAIARETAAQKAAEAGVASAGAERDRVRLAARTREADSAQRNAEAAQRSADASQRNAEASQRSSEASKRDAEAAQRQSEASQRQSEASQRQSEASQRQAANERQAAADAQMGAQAAFARTQEAERLARRLEEQILVLEAKKTARGLVVTLGDVLFDTNQAQLKPAGMKSVQKLADFFKEYPGRTVLIEGFTDSTGGADRNQALSDNRAASVRTALLNMGVGSERITSRGYGEAYPVAGNDTASGRQLNRRVEMIVSDDSGKIAPR